MDGQQPTPGVGRSGRRTTVPHPKARTDCSLAIRLSLDTATAASGGLGGWGCRSESALLVGCQAYKRLSTWASAAPARTCAQAAALGRWPPRLSRSLARLLRGSCEAHRRVDGRARATSLGWPKHVNVAARPRRAYLGLRTAIRGDSETQQHPDDPCRATPRGWPAHARATPRLRCV